jgi:hypothetical protein
LSASLNSCLQMPQRLVKQHQQQIGDAELTGVSGWSTSLFYLLQSCPNIQHRVETRKEFCPSHSDIMPAGEKHAPAGMNAHATSRQAITQLTAALLCGLAFGMVNGISQRPTVSRSSYPGQLDAGTCLSISRDDSAFGIAHTVSTTT